MKTVKFLVDYDCEMLIIKIDGTTVFGGNFWDFKRPHDMIDLVRTLGHSVEVEESEYED